MRSLACFTAVLALAAAVSADVTPMAPAWAEPGSSHHHQIPPPAGFHRPTVTIQQPLGLFTAQSDIGGPLVSGTASFDPARGTYTVTSAGYNIWYFRDEFRYLSKQASGDFTLAATITFPNADGYGDRKAVIVIRQGLEDNAKEAMVALHGAGLIHLASRPRAGADLKETCRLDSQPSTAQHPIRIALRKRGETFTLLLSTAGEALHTVGTPLELRFDSPYDLGIGFCSHQPVTRDTAVFSDVTLSP